MQTQTSNTLHNAIMEAGSKDRPPMLAHDWKDKEVPISEGSPITRTERVHETYKNVSQEIRDQLNAEAKAVQSILTGIHNDIYSTVDACPNACEMWKAIKRLKQGESINVQDLGTNLYWEFRKFTSQDGESLESHYSRSQQAATRNRGKAIVNSLQPIYDQERFMVTEDDETSKDKEIDKLMALISPSINKSAGYENQKIGNVVGARETVGSTVVQKFGIQCYNCKEFRHVARECQKLKRAKDEAYHREKMLLCKQEEARIRLNTEQADWRDDIDDDELEDQELEAHYIEEIDQNDDDNDLAKERELLASLIEKLKCEIDESKNRNKFLETSNKVLIKKLKGEIEDFKNKNKILESSNNYFKEANNRLSETNNLLYVDYKKLEAELARRNSMSMCHRWNLNVQKSEEIFYHIKWNLKSHVLNILKQSMI
nr:ribonuclease H-like domain-containing protein [Tanacetum cinerariifolium]